jgi:hypothetical protein
LAKGTSYSNSSLAECCYTAKIPSPKNDGIEGSQVSEVYYNEGVSRIQKYCERDVISCVHLLQWMRGESLTQDIVYKTEEVKVPLLERLNANKAIYTAELEELKQLLSKKKLTKKEKEVVFDIIKASLSDIDKDFGKVKNQENIDKIINQLKQDFDSN